MNIRSIVILVATSLLVANSQATAQHLVKRVKCKKIDFDNRLTVVYNRSEEPVRFSFQIIRDGCRPLNLPDFMTLQWSDGTTSQTYTAPDRLENTLISGVVEPQGDVKFWLNNYANASIRGTLDYVVTVD